MSIAPGTSNELGIVDDPPGGDPGLCWYRYRTAPGACPVCSPRDGQLINGADVEGWIPAHPHCRCWWELDYCADPADLIPPEDPPGPGPF